MGKKTKARVPVTERALLLRLNRALAKEGEMIHKSRRPDSNTGAYYSINVSLNAVMATDVDLEQRARKSGVLRGWEEVANGR